MAVFHYLHLRTFAHETEDPQKVRRALDNAVQGAEVAWTETNAEGGHRNRILILDGEVKSAPAVKRLFESLARDDPDGFHRLVEESARRVDEHLNFHLRIDKQEACMGRTVLARDEDAITVRGKVRIFGTRRDGVGEAAAAHEVRAFLERIGARGPP